MAPCRRTRDERTNRCFLFRWCGRQVLFFSLCLFSFSCTSPLIYNRWLGTISRDDRAAIKRKWRRDSELLYRIKKKKKLTCSSATSLAGASATVLFRTSDVDMMMRRRKLRLEDALGNYHPLGVRRVDYSDCDLSVLFQDTFCASTWFIHLVIQFFTKGTAK